MALHGSESRKFYLGNFELYYKYNEKQPGILLNNNSGRIGIVDTIMGKYKPTKTMY